MFNRVRKITQPDLLKSEIPMPKELVEMRRKSIDTVKAILSGVDKRLLFIVGPCSADNTDAVTEFAVKLSETARQVSEYIYVLVRVFTLKPRTRGEGYMGMFHCPKPGEIDIENGVRSVRRTHIRVMQESGLCTADEMPYADNFLYTDDLAAYMTVGARSAEDAYHRHIASGLDIPVGFKNPLSGDVKAIVNSVHAAQIQNSFKLGEYFVNTPGNRYAHAILRGYSDSLGKHIPNYSARHIESLHTCECKYGIVNRGVLIDSNHSNSRKNPFLQPPIVLDALKTAETSPYDAFIKGFVVESYLFDGADVSGGTYGMSVTDGCLGIEKTKQLILQVADIRSSIRR